MAALLIRHGEWVVVCDGAKALILENVGDINSPNLKTVEVFEQKDLSTHALGTDAPGRSINSVGNTRSAVNKRTGTIRRERAFLSFGPAPMVPFLPQSKSMIVVAPPRALE
jgi:protein required for attachment to host cells